MMFNAFQRDDPDMMYTTVKREGHYFMVGMDAQELFKAALGEEEWEKRIAEAYAKETGEVAPPPPKTSVDPVETMKQRFIKLGQAGKPIGP